MSDCEFDKTQVPLLIQAVNKKRGQLEIKLYKDLTVNIEEFENEIGLRIRDIYVHFDTIPIWGRKPKRLLKTVTVTIDLEGEFQ